MFKEIIIAFSSYGKAHTVIMQHRLYKWILVPGIIYMLLFSAGFYFFYITAHTFIEGRIISGLGFTQWLESKDSDLLSFLASITGLFGWFVAMLFYFSLFKYLWLIIWSPVFAYFSEKTEGLITGTDGWSDTTNWKQGIGRGIRIALRNLLWQTVYLVPLLILSFIPVVGWVVPFLAMIIECYYLGFSMLDYSFERRNQSVENSIRYIGSHKGLAIGNGMVFYAMHIFPILGWVLAPTYAIVAASFTVADHQALLEAEP